MTPEAVRELRHELRTPVNHLIGYTELLLEEEDIPAELVAQLEGVRSIARQVLELVPGMIEADGTPGEAAQRLRGHVGELERATATLRAAPGNLPMSDLGRLAAAALRLSEFSERLGTGSIATGPAAAKVDTPLTGRLETVLVVDDDEANRDVLARRLQRLGYGVVMACDGVEALACLRAGGVDLVLLDDMGSIVRCIEAGATDYLTKPFDPVLLKARVGASMEKKRLRDSERALVVQVEAQAEELRLWNHQLEQRVAEQVREVAKLSRLRRFLAPQLADAITAGGDDMLVVFNDPLPCDAPARRAVTLALAMRDRARAFRQLA